MADSGDNFDLTDLATLAARLPAVKPWRNPDTGQEFYITFAHPAWFLLLSPRDRWLIDRSRDRAFQRYGVPLLPEWAVGKLAVVMSEYIPDRVA